MKRSLSTWLVLAFCLAPLSCGAPTTAPGQNTKRSAPMLAPAATTEVYVVLDGPAAADLLPSNGVETPSVRAAVNSRMRSLTIEHEAIRSAIEATGGVITADLKRLVNAIQVRVPVDRVRELESLPGVVRVDPVTMLHRHLAQAVPLIGAPKVWQLSTPIRGKGISIGIVDTGIDYTHADFGGPGTVAAYDQNDPTVIEPGTFPTARVVGGWDFVGDDYDATNAATAIPKPDPDPLDCAHPASTTTSEVSGGHGTHVSGIAAGNGVLTNGKAYMGPYDESLDPSAFTVFPGVAPEASLYALKIFGCAGSTDQLAAALEWAADPNKDNDFSDHLDVVNASLGTSYGLGSQAEEDIIKNLAKVGTLLVVAAGNDGSAFYSAGSPGVYPETLSVAASSSSNLVALTVDSPASIKGQVAAAEGTFTTRLASAGPITGKLVYVQPHDACATLTNAAALKGNIALIDRGTCPFVDKFNRAVAAGAVAGVVVDDVASTEPMVMGGGTRNAVPIPGVLIRKADGTPIESDVAQGVTVTLDANPYTGPGSETIASFSSRGPSSSGSLLKPEISAPGMRITSAGVGSGSGSRNMSGTSMASPMVTGAAALVREARPGLSPYEVKAALMNTAKPIQDLAGNDFPISMQGAGLVSVDAAVSHHVTAMEKSTDGSVGLSFGAVVTDKPYSDTRQITLKNHGTTSIDYQATMTTGYALPGVTLDVSPKSFTLAGGATQDVTVTLHVDPQKLGAPGPDPETPPTLDFGNNTSEPRQFLNEASGHIVFTGGTKGDETVGVPYEAVVRSAADRHAGPIEGCALSSKNATLQIPITGDSANPDPIVTAFQLGDSHQPVPGETDANALLDLVAIGAATDTATKDAANASVYFGLAIAGQWTTPALGPLSRVAVLIDTNFDGQADYEVSAVPLTQNGPYADVLAADTYNVATQQLATDGQRFLNIVGPDKLRTAPFDNSVVVLPVFLHSIGLDAKNAHFQYAGITQSDSILQRGQQTKWIDYDALHPAIDTAQGGLDGQPIYKSGQPVVVHVDDTKAPLPDVLLLHHMNVQGKRWEVVNLAKQLPGLESGNLVLSASGPAHVTYGSQVPFSVKLVNDSKTDRAGVTLTGSVTGATLLSATPTRGSCKLSPSLSCDFGTMKAGETISVKLDSKATQQGPTQTAELSVKAASTYSCETTLGDNKAKVVVALEAVPIPPTPATPVTPTPVYDPTGGCSGCRVGANPENPGEAAFTSFLLLLGLGWRRRRR